MPNYVKNLIFVAMGVTVGSIVTKIICGKNEKKRREELIKMIPDAFDQAIVKVTDDFIELMNDSFSNSETSFQSSIELARKVGVPEDKILKTKEDIDKFFLKKED